MFGWLMKWILWDIHQDLKLIHCEMDAFIIDTIKEKLAMRATIQDIITAVHAQTDAIVTIASDINTLLAKLPVPPDLQGELDKINANITTLQDAHSKIQAALNLPEETPAPAETPIQLGGSTIGEGTNPG